MSSFLSSLLDIIKNLKMCTWYTFNKLTTEHKLKVIQIWYSTT